MRCASFIALIGVLAFAADASAQKPVIQIGSGSNIVPPVTIAELLPATFPLTLCEPDRSPAFLTKRSTGLVWAGQFRIVSATEDGWVLKVTDLQGSLLHQHAISRVPKEARWGTGLLPAAVVQLRIERSNETQTHCPLVMLESELQPKLGGLPRGLVGPDDRWTESQSELLAQPDALLIRGWADALVHLEVMGQNGRLAPCSGFFVSQHIVLSASHCLPSPEVLAASLVYFAGQWIPIERRKLLMSIQDNDTDFCLLWVDRPPGVQLTLGESDPGTAVLWQYPQLSSRLVSVVDCAVSRIDPSRIVHQCDTVGGSSGSPIQIRSTGAVAGLHSSGCTTSNGLPTCVNYGVRPRDIRAMILKYQDALRQWDAPATTELLAAMSAWR